MGLLDGILGGVVGGEMVSVVNNLDREARRRARESSSSSSARGWAARSESWVGTGQNQSISPDQVHQAFGQDTIAAMAAKIGMSPQDLANKPLGDPAAQAIDKLTPGGVVPPS